MVLKGVSMSLKVNEGTKLFWKFIKVIKGSEWSVETLKIFKIYWKFESWWKDTKWLDWSEMSWKVPKGIEKVPWYVLKCPERFLMLKGFQSLWKVSKRSPERSWKGPKMSWIVRKCTRIFERSLNSRRYGMLCVLVFDGVP